MLTFGRQSASEKNIEDADGHELSVQFFPISQNSPFPNFLLFFFFFLSLIPHFTLSLRRITHSSSISQMDLYTAASLLSHSSPSSHHFLHFSSSPPPALSPSDEFNESELFWTADFVQSSNNSSRSRKISTDDRASSFIPPPNSGILAALSDDFNYDRKKRIGTILTRDTTSITKSPSSSTRSIPRPVQSNRDYSQSVPCRKFQQSAPIKVPEAMRKGRNDRDHVERKEEEEEEQMLPPHEIVRRGSGMSPNTTFSVLEGAGRTLKGRDLRRVRNAVWHRTGFVD